MTGSTPCADAIAHAARSIAETTKAAAGALSDTYGLKPPDALALLQKAVSAFYRPLPAYEADARAATWRCRFRLFNTLNMDEAEADSDPELAPDRPGTEIIAGLPAVGATLLAYAISFHDKAALINLTHERITHSLRGLRPTLSRRGGDAVWRIPYETVETTNGREVKRSWLARVDVSRVTKEEKA